MSHVGALMLQCSMLSSMVIIRRWRLPRMCITVRTLSIQSETLAQTICVGAQTQMATKDQCKLDCWMIISVVTLFRWAQRTSQLLTKIDRGLGSWKIKVKKYISPKQLVCFCWILASRGRSAMILIDPLPGGSSCHHQHHLHHIQLKSIFVRFLLWRCFQSVASKSRCTTVYLYLCICVFVMLLL